MVEEAREKFVRCKHCGLPHAASLAACPFTGRTISGRTRLPADAGAIERALKPICGTTVCGKYRVDKLLGTGSMGAVYQAQHIYLRKRVALKVLLCSFDTETEAGQRFMREAQAAGQIDHPNVVRLFDVGSLDDGSPFIVMELLEGEELAERLSREGPLPQDEAIDIACEILEGLAAAHDLGVIHRDVKPANVYLAAKPGGGARAKVLDFSISSLPEVERLTQTGQILGTPHYLSPEQAMGEPDIDPRVDVWSVGICLFQMLTGRVPFDASNLAELLTCILEEAPPVPSEFRKGLHRDLDGICVLALGKAPGQRFKNARVMIRALRDIGAQVQDMTVSDSVSPFADETIPGFDDSRAEPAIEDGRPGSDPAPRGGWGRDTVTNGD